jgi:hypothetical protein
MFGHQHYVPVMRMKPAELNLRALRGLDPALRSGITPLLECPPRMLRRCDSLASLEERIDYFVEHLAGWAGRSVFIDFSMLSSTMSGALKAMADRAARTAIRPVFVVSLKDGRHSVYRRLVQAALDRHGSSICLRLSPEELKLTDIDELIDSCLEHYAASPGLVDLVIDRGGVDSGTFIYQDFAHLIPSIDSWRSLTVLAGSFPEDLCRFSPGKSHRLQRFEWQQWRSLESWPGRRPAFGDYTIQHVVFKEPVAVPNFSASVRYTIEEEYFILRGEGVLNEGGPGYGQWNAWAKLLIGMPEFFGAAFSAGDQYIVDRATNWNTPGSAQTWLQAGFSHHVTTTALQVAGWLDEVRRITGSAAVSAWSSVVDINQPSARL